MRLKLDENLPRSLRESLAALGHDVDTVGDEGLLSRPDAEVATEAFADGRALFTLDLDFADIRRFPPGTHPGVFVFRPREQFFVAVEQLILDFTRTNDVQSMGGCLVIIDQDRVRVRRPTPPTDMG